MVQSLSMANLTITTLTPADIVAATAQAHAALYFAGASEVSSQTSVFAQAREVLSDQGNQLLAHRNLDIFRRRHHSAATLRNTNELRDHLGLVDTFIIGATRAVAEGSFNDQHLAGLAPLAWLPRHTSPAFRALRDGRFPIDSRISDPWVRLSLANATFALGLQDAIPVEASTEKLSDLKTILQLMVAFQHAAVHQMTPDMVPNFIASTWNGVRDFYNALERLNAGAYDFAAEQLKDIYRGEARGSSTYREIASFFRATALTLAANEGGELERFAYALEAAREFKMTPFNAISPELTATLSTLVGSRIEAIPAVPFSELKTAFDALPPTPERSDLARTAALKYVGLLDAAAAVGQYHPQYLDSANALYGLITNPTTTISAEHAVIANHLFRSNPTPAHALAAAKLADQAGNQALALDLKIFAAQQTNNIELLTDIDTAEIPAGERSTIHGNREWRPLLDALLSETLARRYASDNSPAALSAAMIAADAAISVILNQARRQLGIDDTSKLEAALVADKNGDADHLLELRQLSITACLNWAAHTKSLEDISRVKNAVLEHARLRELFGEPPVAGPDAIHNLINVARGYLENGNSGGAIRALMLAEAEAKKQAEQTVETPSS